MQYGALVESPIGQILLQADTGGLTGLYFTDRLDHPDSSGDQLKPSAGLLNNKPLRKYKVLPETANDLFARATQPICTAQSDYQLCSYTESQTPTEIKSILDLAILELDQYWHGQLHDFTVALNPRGSDFQLKVWQALLRVKLGTILSYGELGQLAGFGSKHGRAMGTAVGSNPISIIIPCHRILASDHSLNGYGGGLQRKLQLLQHEGLYIV